MSIKQAQKELAELEEEFSTLISEKLAELEESLTEQMHAKLAAIAQKYQIGFAWAMDYDDALEEYALEFDSKEDVLQELPKRIKEIAEMFVNNTITQTSIWSDPSGDWDGDNREHEFYKKAYELSQLDKINFDQD